MTDDRPTRREADDRLVEIEELVRNLTREVGRIRDRLGDRNTTLIYDLDQRYPTRQEVARDYVPRAEHEAQRKWTAQMRNSVALILIGAAGWLTTLIEVLAHHR